MKKDFFRTPDEVGKCLQVSKSTIYRWVRIGYIPYRKVDGLIKFDARDIIEWLDSKRVNG